MGLLRDFCGVGGEVYVYCRFESGNWEEVWNWWGVFRTYMIF